MVAASYRLACEFRRKVWRLLAAAVIVALPALVPAHADRLGVRATVDAAGQPQAHEAAAPAHAETGADHESESPWSLIAKLVNFAILAGTLVYLLRSPLGQYVIGRSAGIRQDLVTAAEMRSAAAAQIEELARRLQALPAEIENLKARGAEEIAEEEARIAQAAEAERQRLLEQTRREIDLQLRAAKKELVQYAADLAVGTASERIKRNITPADHLRLVDQYVDRVKVSEP